MSVFGTCIYKKKVLFQSSFLKSKTGGACFSPVVLCCCLRRHHSAINIAASSHPRTVTVGSYVLRGV